MLLAGNCLWNLDVGMALGGDLLLNETGLRLCWEERTRDAATPAAYGLLASNTSQIPDTLQSVFQGT